MSGQPLLKRSFSLSRLLILRKESLKDDVVLTARGTVGSTATDAVCGHQLRMEYGFAIYVRTSAKAICFGGLNRKRSHLLATIFKKSSFLLRATSSTAPSVKTTCPPSPLMYFFR